MYSSDNTVLGSTNSLNEDEKSDIANVSEELKINEEELKIIIDKGNELYTDFYGE